MKVLNACQSDWSNFSEDNAAALRSVGVDCTSVKEKAHVFGYESESPVMKMNSILSMMKRHDIIQIMHTDIKMLNLAKMAKAKRVVVYHTGTSYRREPQRFNSLFNPEVAMTLTDQCEFMSLGAKGMQYVATAVDTDKILKSGMVKFPYRVAHFPSCSKIKGSEAVISAVRKVHAEHQRFHFRYSDARVDHPEQLARMRGCEIYVELFAPTQEGNPYGCFGVTAFEAAAMGKVVVTQNINQKAYTDAYGECELVICNTKGDLLSALRRLVRVPRKEMESMQKRTREWMEKKHSYKATGERIKGILLQI